MKRKIKLAKNSCYKFYLKLLYGKKISTGTTNFGKRFEFDIVAKNFSVVFGNKVSFKRYGLICMRGNAILNIGNNVFFNSYISINCHQKITIGNDCLFGENVKIYDHNHKYADKQIPVAQQGYNYGEINIGNNCWIGSAVIILKGVTIGDNCVIGAGSIIYKDIPVDTIIKSQNS